MAENEQCFDGLKAWTTIPGKSKYYKRRTIRGETLGRLIVHVPSHPVFPRDMFTPDKLSQDLRQQTITASNQYDIDWIDDRKHLALHAEGKCNTENPRVVLPPNRGIANIALGVEDIQNLGIVNIGIAYKTVIGQLHLRPVAVVDELFNPAGLDADSILSETHARMQLLVDRAFELAA